MCRGAITLRREAIRLRKIGETARTFAPIDEMDRTMPKPTPKKRRKKAPQRRRGKVVNVSRPLPEVFGIEIHYQPDELAPAVDLDKLAKFVRQELTRAERVAVSQLIADFRPWHDAFAMLKRRKLPN